MAFEKLVSFTKDVSDLADKPALGSASALKAQFDAAPDEVRVYLNKLIDSLKSTVSGDSGAKNIGASAIPGLTGSDIQTLLQNTVNAAVFGKASSVALSSGFVILSVVPWIKEMHSESYESVGTSNIRCKKSGLYKVELSMTRSDLPANQYWNIGYAINDAQATLSNAEIVMGQYGWNQSSGANNSKVPLSLSELVRLTAGDYINFNINSQDGPRSYENIRFSIVKISD